jgi:hypothetical protein
MNTYILFGKIHKSVNCFSRIISILNYDSLKIVLFKSYLLFQLITLLLINDKIYFLLLLYLLRKRFTTDFRLLTFELQNIFSFNFIV